MFNSILSEVDPTIANAIALEGKRQADQNELIALENIVSKPILEAQGSLLTNKYAEGYPGRRYYGGCEHVDVVEAVVIECLCTIFDANLQMFMPCTSSNG